MTMRVGFREAVLWLGAVLGVLCLLLAVAGTVAGVRPLVFRSGSMAPAIDTGALALTRSVPAASVRPGDVVSVVAASGERVTHRVVSVSGAGPERDLVLRGDANARADDEVYRVSRTDRVLVDVPWLGRVVAASMSPLGLLVIAGLVVACLALAFGPRGPDRRPPRQRGRRRAVPPGRAERRITALLAVAATSLGLAGPAVAAAWTDEVPLADASYVARVPAHDQPHCDDVNGLLVLGNIARLTWPQARAGLEYVWELRRADSSVASRGVVGTGTPEGATVVLEIATGLIGANANYTVVVWPRVSARQDWVGSTTSTLVHRRSIVIIGAAFRCGHL